MEKDQPAPTAKRLLLIAQLLLIALPLSALGTRFGLWDFTVGFIILLSSIAGCFLLQIIQAYWLLRRPSAATKKLLRRSSLFAMPPLFLAAVFLYQNGDLPGIHNISTDLVDPPHYIAAIKERGSESNPLEYTADIAEIQQRAYPQVQTLLSNLSVAESYQRALVICEQLGWRIYFQDSEQGHIEAVERTRWFGFQDDIVIRIREHAKGSKLDLRSVSRVGEDDLGANAKRIQQFQLQFNSNN